MHFIRARAARIARLTNAPNRRQWSVDQSDDSAKLYPLHGSRERIAPKLSAPAFHVSGRFKLCKNLLEKLDWQFFFYGQFAYLEHWPAEFGGDAEIDKSSERIFAAFGKFHVLFLCVRITRRLMSIGIALAVGGTRRAKEDQSIRSFILYLVLYLSKMSTRLV